MSDDRTGEHSVYRIISPENFHPTNPFDVPDSFEGAKLLNGQMNGEWALRFVKQRNTVTMKEAICEHERRDRHWVIVVRGGVS